jgi:hypothetical protein
MDLCVDRQHSKKRRTNKNSVRQYNFKSGLWGEGSEKIEAEKRTGAIDAFKVSSSFSFCFSLGKGLNCFAGLNRFAGLRV